MSVANLTRYKGAFNEYPNCDCCILQDSNGEYDKFDEAVEASSNSLQQLKAEIAAYTKEVMDKIDDAKDRGAVNDLSVIAYALVNKLIAATSAV